LEADDRSRDELRDYLDALEKAAIQSRTPGGRFKAGRALRPSRSYDPTKFRGEPLMPTVNDYAATLPAGSQWRILSICRTAPEAELAFLYEDATNCYGLVGFHRIGDSVKRGVIIPIAQEYDDAINAALEAFAAGDMDVNNEEELPADAIIDDGLLADDEGTAHA